MNRFNREPSDSDSDSNRRSNRRLMPIRPSSRMEEDGYIVKTITTTTTTTITTTSYILPARQADGSGSMIRDAFRGQRGRHGNGYGYGKDE